MYESHTHEVQGAEAASNHATHRRDDRKQSARPASRLGSMNAARRTGGLLSVIPTVVFPSPTCSAPLPSRPYRLLLTEIPDANIIKDDFSSATRSQAFCEDANTTAISVQIVGKIINLLLIDVELVPTGATGT